MKEVGDSPVVGSLSRSKLGPFECTVDSGRACQTPLGSFQHGFRRMMKVRRERRRREAFLQQERCKSGQEVLLRLCHHFHILAAQDFAAFAGRKGGLDDLAKVLVRCEFEEVLMENGDLGGGVPSSRHKESVAFHNKSRSCEREAVAGVHEVLVEEVAVLVLLHACVEEAGAVGKAEFADSLLEEVKVLVGETVLGLQLGHSVRLGEHDHHVEPQVPHQHPFLNSFQGRLLLTRTQVRKWKLKMS